ncbi:MAG: PorV/PorQ family protein [Bacteroidetes bacterium]|nr:PorV/PorQ family protein [Bacteroidota bacterium]
MRILTVIWACLVSVSLVLGIETAQAQLLPSLGGERAGTSGFQFLKIPVDARAAALGESVVASAFDISSLYWNPALASHLPGIQAGFHHTAYFVDVNLEFAGVNYHLPGTNVSLGASLQTLNSGQMKVTTEFEPFGTGESFRFIDIAAGLTLSQQLTDLFSYGITTKYIRESVVGLSTSTVAFDLGIYYAVGTTGARMGVAVRNIGLDQAPKGKLARTVIGTNPVVVESDFESLTAPTTFHLGFAYDLLKSSPNSAITLSTQLNKPNDNAENWNFGAEFGWKNTLFVRTGYRFGIEEMTVPSFGTGLRVPLSGAAFKFDYGFNQLERLGSVHRMGMSVEF